MISNGIYFTKLAALGPGKPIAALDFKKGLNVLAGASETGKSYVLDCIDYILGSQKTPKNIIESTGYDEIRAEIRTFDEKIFTLKRKFNDNFIYVAECNIEEFQLFRARKLSSRHNPKNEQNISYFLLSLLKLDGKKLKKNNRNVTRTLSFRDLAKFCLVRETQIIGTGSPIYRGEKFDETVNESLFRLLLTGKDDDDLERIEDPAIRKSRINGKIELIKQDLESKQKLLLKIRERTDSLSTEDINIQIQKLINIVEKAHEGVKSEESKRASVWSVLDSLKSKLSQNEQVLQNFILLDKHYSSDLKRLEFIYEGKNGFDQLKNVNCPLCDSLIDQKILEPCPDNIEVLNSVKGEYFKIKAKKADLKETITELILKISKNKLKIAAESREYEKIDNFIKVSLKPVHKIHSAQLDNFLRLKAEKTKIGLIEEQISELNFNLKYYSEKLNEKKKVAIETTLPEEIYRQLENEIRTVLISWGLDCKTVRYNPSVNDIEINGEKRSNSGKGYRAIYLSGFMVAVLSFCVKNNLKHPRFLVLDSPLTPFKGRDKENLTPEDKISIDVQNKFYESMANLDIIDRVQIIVIENIDPSLGIRKKMNYEHFSKNTKVGRYGFYPPI